MSVTWDELSPEAREAVLDVAVDYLKSQNPEIIVRIAAGIGEAVAHGAESPFVLMHYFASCLADELKKIEELGISAEEKLVAVGASYDCIIAMLALEQHRGDFNLLSMAATEHARTCSTLRKASA